MHKYTDTEVSTKKDTNMCEIYIWEINKLI